MSSWHENSNLIQRQGINLLGLCMASDYGHVKSILTSPSYFPLNDGTVCLSVLASLFKPVQLLTRSVATGVQGVSTCAKRLSRFRSDISKLDMRQMLNISRGADSWPICWRCSALNLFLLLLTYRLLFLLFHPFDSSLTVRLYDWSIRVGYVWNTCTKAQRTALTFLRNL